MRWTVLPGIDFVSPHLSDQIQLTETTRVDNSAGGWSTATATATIADYGDYQVCYQVLCVDVLNGGLEYTDQCCSKIGVLHTPRLPPFCECHQLIYIPACFFFLLEREINFPASMTFSPRHNILVMHSHHARTLSFVLFFSSTGPAALPPNTIVGAAGAGRARSRFLTSDGVISADGFGDTGGAVSKHACDFVELDAGRPLQYPSSARRLAEHYPYIASIEPYNTITNDIHKNPVNVDLNRVEQKKTLIIQDENTKPKRPKMSAYGGCMNITFAHETRAVAVRDFGLSDIPSGQVATVTLVHVSGWETTLTSPESSADATSDDTTSGRNSSSNEWIASSTYRAELSALTAANLKEMHICIPSTGAVTFIDTSVCDEDYSSSSSTGGTGGRN
jgi:hypothetical protein